MPVGWPSGFVSLTVIGSFGSSPTTRWFSTNTLGTRSPVVGMRKQLCDTGRKSTQVANAAGAAGFCEHKLMQTEDLREAEVPHQLNRR